MKDRYSVWINHHMRRDFTTKQAALTYAYSWKDLFPHLKVTIIYKGKKTCL